MVLRGSVVNSKANVICLTINIKITRRNRSREGGSVSAGGRTSKKEKKREKEM